MKKLANEINKILDEIFKIGDEDECSFKNIIYTLYSIYFYNDLNHIIDYRHNGHSDEDTEKYIQLWNSILDKLNTLPEKKRKSLMEKYLINMVIYNRMVDYYKNESYEYIKGTLR